MFAAHLDYYNATLDPLNDSDVSGSAFLTLNTRDDQLTVEIDASGLEARKPHPQHIHGFPADDGTPQDAEVPTLAVDDPANGGDGDGFIELAEGATTYGPILVPLTSPAGGAIKDFPTAPNGSIDFSQTYDLASSDVFADDFNADSLGEDLTLREIVLHGMTLPASAGEGTDGQADGSAGYKAVLPVAAGEITDAPAPSVPTPATLSLLGLGLLGLAAFGRSRQAR